MSKTNYCRSTVLRIVLPSHQPYSTFIDRSLYRYAHRRPAEPSHWTGGARGAPDSPRLGSCPHWFLSTAKSLVASLTLRCPVSRHAPRITCRCVRKLSSPRPRFLPPVSPPESFAMLSSPLWLRSMAAEVLFLVTAALFVAASGMSPSSSSAAATMTSDLMTIVKLQGVKCIDGSPAAYYIARNVSSPNVVVGWSMKGPVGGWVNGTAFVRCLVILY